MAARASERCFCLLAVRRESEWELDVVATVCTASPHSSLLAALSSSDIFSSNQTKFFRTPTLYLHVSTRGWVLAVLLYITERALELSCNRTSAMIRYHGALQTMMVVGGMTGFSYAPRLGRRCRSGGKWKRRAPLLTENEAWFLALFFSQSVCTIGTEPVMTAQHLRNES